MSVLIPLAGEGEALGRTTASGLGGEAGGGVSDGRSGAPALASFKMLVKLRPAGGDGVDGFGGDTSLPTGLEAVGSGDDVPGAGKAGPGDDTPVGWGGDENVEDFGDDRTGTDGSSGATLMVVAESDTLGDDDLGADVGSLGYDVNW